VAAGIVVVVEVDALPAVAKANLAAFLVLDHLDRERHAAGLAALGHDLADLGFIPKPDQRRAHGLEARDVKIGSDDDHYLRHC